MKKQTMEKPAFEPTERKGETVKQTMEKPVLENTERTYSCPHQKCRKRFSSWSVFIDHLNNHIAELKLEIYLLEKEQKQS